MKKSLAERLRYVHQIPNEAEEELVEGDLEPFDGTEATSPNANDLPRLLAQARQPIPLTLPADYDLGVRPTLLIVWAEVLP